MKTLTNHSLSNYYGTENWYRHPFSSLLYTDGVQHVAEAGEAYWLLDILATESPRLLKTEEFLSWKLTVKEDKTGLLIATDGNNHVLYSRELEYTDFPLPEISFYVTGGVILLTSEY